MNEYAKHAKSVSTDLVKDTKQSDDVSTTSSEDTKKSDGVSIASSKDTKQSDGVSAEDTKQSDEVYSQSPTGAAVHTAPTTTITTPARNSVQAAKHKNPVFRPPLRRLSTGSSTSKLHAAFKSPLRNPDAHKPPPEPPSSASSNTCTTAGTTHALTSPLMSSRRTPRPTPYPTRTSRGRATKMTVKDTPEKVAQDVEELRKELESVECEIDELSKDYCEEELQQYIDLLHEYNEIKDVGQVLLGKIAEVQGTTTAELYQRFELNLDD